MTEEFNTAVPYSILSTSDCMVSFRNSWANLSLISTYSLCNGMDYLNCNS